MKLKYCGLAFFFIYIFAISNTISNAMVSISVALLLIYTIYIYKHEKISLPNPGLALQIPWWVFFITIFIASLGVADKESIKMAADYFYLSLPFWLLLAFYYRYPQPKLFLSAIALSFILIGGKSLYVYDVVNKLANTRVIAFDANINNVATLLIVSLPFMFTLFLRFYKKNKSMAALLLLGGIVGLAALILTGSRGAMIGFGAACIIIVILKLILLRDRRKSAQDALVCFTLCAIILSTFTNFRGDFQRSYDVQRLLFLKSSYAMWQDHKLVGVGLCNWGQEYNAKYILPAATEKDITIPHNTVVYFFSTTGIIGGVGFLIFSLGLIIYLCKMMGKQPDNYLIQAMLWSFLAMSGHGLVDAGLTTRIVFRLFAAYMGVTVASILLYEKSKLQMLRDAKPQTTPEQYRKQRYYGQMVGHRNDREDFR